MNIDYIKVGPIQTNCYIIEDEGEVMVIDPGDNLTQIVAELKGRPVKQIVLTHFHWDHVTALSGLEEVTGAPAIMSAVDAPFVDGVANQEGRDIAQGHGAPHIDKTLNDGDEIRLGSKTFKVIASPGHSHGSICLYCEEDGVLFTGDTIFAGGRYGRTDFDQSSPEEMLESLQTKFIDIPDDVKVFPGHESFSTMGTERALNPYLR